MPRTHLPPVSAVDIIFYLALLAVHYVLHGPLFRTIITVLRCIPFLLFSLPYQLLRSRWFYKHGNRAQGTLFQQVVLRCMKYSFVNLPITVARGFFDVSVIIPFYTFRLLRSGLFRHPAWPEWRWIDGKENQYGTGGIWIQCRDRNHLPPDVVVLYLHGGGFALGSPEFYLEPLATVCALLRYKEGFNNPAVLIAKYSLAPEAHYPVQQQQAERALLLAVSLAGGDCGKVVVAGDSAGGALGLGLLYGRGNMGERVKLGVFVSPWVDMDAEVEVEEGDFLDSRRLRELSKEYAGAVDVSDVSPGDWRDDDNWRRGIPLEGVRLMWTEGEVLAEGVEKLGWRLEKVVPGMVGRKRVEGSVHCEAIARMWLGGAWEERGEGLRWIAGQVGRAFGERKESEE